MENKKPQTKAPASPAQKNQPSKSPQQQQQNGKSPSAQQKKPGSNW